MGVENKLEHPADNIRAALAAPDAMTTPAPKANAAATKTPNTVQSTATALLAGSGGRAQVPTPETSTSTNVIAQKRSSSGATKKKDLKDLATNMANRLTESREAAAGALGELSTVIAESRSQQADRDAQLLAAQERATLSQVAARKEIADKDRHAHDLRQLRTEAMQYNMFQQKLYATQLEAYRRNEMDAVSEAKRDALQYARQQGYDMEKTKEYVREMVQMARETLPPEPSPPELKPIPDLGVHTSD